MNTYALLPLSSLLVNLFLLGYVGGSIGRQPVRAAQAYLWALGACCWWASGDFVAWGLLHDEDGIGILRATSPAWILASFLFLRMAYAVTERPRDWLHDGLLGCAVFGSVAGVATDWVLVESTRTYWGVRPTLGWGYPAIFFLCILVPGVMALYLTARAAVASNGLRRVQLALYAAGISSAFLGAIVVNVGVVEFLSLDVPTLGSTLTAVQSCFAAVAMVRYRFLAVGVHHAAVGIFSHASDGVVLLDLDGKVAEVNARAASLLGAARGLGTPGASLFPPPFPPEGCLDGWKLQLPHPSGERTLLVSRNDLHEGERLVGQMVSFRDITDLENAAREVALGERRFKDITHSMGDWAWETDVALNYTFVSGRIHELMGCQEREVIGRNLLEFVDPRDLPSVRSRLQTVPTEGQRLAGVVARHTHRDGSSRWFSTTLVPVFEAGCLRGYRGVHEDVTERRRAEDERIRLEEQVRDMQERKLAALGQLAGGIAHDFNNMLTGIAGYVELLAGAAASADQQRQYVQSVRKLVNQGAAITRQMLTFARRSTVEFAAFDAHESIARTAVLLRHSLGRHLTVVQDLRATETTVHGNAHQFESALLNLAINARDAMPDGGVLTLASRNLVPDEAPVSSARPINPQPLLEFSIIDNGTGMSEETRLRVFEPFFTTKAAGRGTGLGLASVYGMVKQHGGTVSVESQLGQGTTFRIVLPTVTPVANGAREILRDTAPSPGTTVLVVDDDPDIRATLGEVLRQRGFRVLVASDGVEALSVHAEEGGAIHLVLLDWVMPRMGGAQCAAELRRLHPDLPIVVLSGHTGGEDDGVPSGQRPFTFLEKPVETELLLLALQQAVRTAESGAVS